MTAPAEAALGLAVAVILGATLGRLATGLADADLDRQGATPAVPDRSRSWLSVDVTQVVAIAVTSALLARFGASWVAIPFPIVVAAGVATAVTDLRNHRIPNRIVFPAIITCGATMVVAALVADAPERLVGAAAGASLYSGILLVVHLAAPHGLGLGDVKLAVLLGGAIGWLGPVSLATVELVIWAVIGASGLGLMVGLAGAVANRRGRPDGFAGSLRRRAIPFGPSLSTAALGVVLVGDRLVR